MRDDTAAEVARSLEVGLDCGICLACLSFVPTAVDRGDEREIDRWVREMTPQLWTEGLSGPALAAAEAAAGRGGEDAALALADLRARGGSSVVARALVRRLGEALNADSRARYEELVRAWTGVSPIGGR